LDSTDGHLFTIQLQGLKDFAEVKSSERIPLLTRKRTILNLNSGEHAPVALKFVAHWYSKSALLRRMDRFGSNPWLTAERPDGTTVRAVLLENAFLQTQHPSYLLLTCEPVPMIDNSRYSSLTFVGGFDPPEVALDHNLDTSFLALAYPATESYDTLRRRIGCVDLRAPEVV
jgi:hypothetical protein